MHQFSVSGNVVDIFNKNIFPGEVFVEDGKITQIQPVSDLAAGAPFILPGFIDAHVHIESSMLVPSEFARLAVVHGTVSTVSDPHEIANVCGMEGVEFMIENGKTVPFKFNFGAPSCVPATIFETAGAALNSDDVKKLLERPEVKYLSEMMNFPGVLHQDEEVMKKIAAAHALGKPVDGHAPGLRGELVKQYIQAGMNAGKSLTYAPKGVALDQNNVEGGEKKHGSENPPFEGREAVGISTDHECFTTEEALDKLAHGMKILIREGSAAKNFEALIELLNDWPDNIMFCSDDKHPDSLADGHINQLCERAIAKGIDIFKVLQAACVNPVLHYKLDVGLLREGDPADFIVLEDLVHFRAKQTYIDGIMVAEDGVSKISSPPSEIINQFDCDALTTDSLRTVFDGESNIPVIEALDGQLITNKIMIAPKVDDGLIVSDTGNDVLKMVVVNRYSKAPIAKAWVKNFGFQLGAIASSVAHDSHNIIAVGVDDESLCRAVNLVVKERGGVSCISGDKELVLALPVAGLMSNEDGYKVAAAYTAIDVMAKSLGSKLSAPFMTLSFMALLVIPHLKLSDKGLFDGDSFSFI
ncbi:MAG: adenine deaminase C-terminal domain-containing protein [Chitinophagaceae bacterium]